MTERRALSVPESVSFAGRGVQLAADRWAASDPKGTLLLLHGGGQTRHSWARTAPALAAQGWTSIVFDLRGHGDSGWARDGDYSLRAFVDDLLAVIGSLDGPPVLVGASLGGIASLVSVGEHPGVAAGLVLVDVVVSLEPEGIDRIRAFMAGHGDGFASLQEASDAIAQYNPNRPRPRNLDGLRKNLRLGDDGRWYWHWDPAFMAIHEEARRPMPVTPLRHAAAAVDVPTLIVRGVQSDVVSDAGVADMLTLIPHAEVVDVAAAGHMVAGDDNDVFAARLEDFLQRIRSGASGITENGDRHRRARPHPPARPPRP